MSRSCTTACRQPGPSHAHCAAASCHTTFATIGSFDDHRRGGQCLPPASIGLVERDRLWASPERHAADERNTERLAVARSQGRCTGTDGRTGIVGTSTKAAG